MLRSLSAAAIGLVVVSFASPSKSESTQFGFDQGHTEIRMIWNHVGMSEQSAEFLEVSGMLAFDPADLSSSEIEVTIPASSIHTGFALFDDHIQGADFFDVANHPEITFKSTSAVQTGSNTGIVTGDLTIKGVTQSVDLRVTMNFDGPHPLGQFVEAYSGVRYTAFAAETEILRSDFNMGAYAPLTSDLVRIEISTEMAEQSSN